MTSTRETVEAHKQERIDRLVAMAEEQRSDQPGAAAFVRCYYARVAPQDVLGPSLEDLLGAALAVWDFAATREPGAAAVRAYNPTVQHHGYDSDHTVLEVVHDDMPFLVDSVTGELNRRERTVHLVVHPVVTVKRDDDGQRQEGPDAAGGLRESMMHVEVDQETSPEALEGLRRALERVLADVRTVVEDFVPMREALHDLIHRLTEQAGDNGGSSLRETRKFLEWLDSNHFTYLGYRRYRLVDEGAGDEVGDEGAGDAEGDGPGPVGGHKIRVAEDSALGLLRGKDYETFPLTPEASSPIGANPLLVVSKAGRRSSVHRPVHMDYVGVRQLDEAGRTVGGWSFIGLFTSTVYNTSAITVPVLSEKIRRVLERAGFTAQSHDAKALLHILDTFPRDELFQMTEEQLYQTSLGVLQLQERQRLALFVRQDPAERFVSCLLYAPRDRYNTSLRKRMQHLLESAFEGTLSAYYTQVADSPLARVHFIIRTSPGRLPEVDVEALEARLQEAALSWTDRLQWALVERHGEEEGLDLLERFGEAFPASYREHFDADATVSDIAELQGLLGGENLRLDLYRPPEASPHEVRFKIFHSGYLRPLTDVLPMLENMGLTVVAEVPYEITPQGASMELWMRDLRLTSNLDGEVDLAAVRESFQDLFEQVWRGEMESDAFNRLVLAAGLEGRRIVVLRAYARYLRQVGVAYSQTYMAETLARNPRVTRLLVDLFEARFDPQGATSEDSGLTEADPACLSGRQAREERCREIQLEIRSALNDVSTLDEDRILRRFRNLVEATVRTNFYQRRSDASAKPYLSLKLDSGRVTALPRPRPRFEIFVYSPRTEAVHLRGGPVARGGIRWSDRREDFRSEILHLMKAQMVKNAVIVPVGAKGGFIVKRPPSGQEAALREGKECYRTMMRGLLDITDNLVGEKLVPPPRVVRWDDDDPYLVVAADKGTATFSDTANEVAAEYGFWLGDAFASGGSAGYDHKKMGITAKGAWESVKRHFRELGKDIQTDPFTAVGVGDMSGDVFGNGMLLSRQTRLIGAFNHLHVFVDPDPDPAASWEERKRLFDLPRSTWDDYNRTVLSAGGAIYDRAAKSLELTGEIRQLLGIQKKTVTPNELIKALLKAPVELLFFGGIGTYVKASDESHADTGDRQNDAVRVNARDVRALVIGEGANLGLTQRGRIELALEGMRRDSGGKINTDFIDNSGGVDCSDHEVNIKILLGEALGDGRLDLEQRNQLLSRMTGDVSALVLRDNYLQSQAITVTETLGVEVLDQQQQLIRTLEQERNLDRSLEDLPSDEELAQRRAQGRGLTRPEIAVLLAYGKIHLYEQLLASDLPDDPLLVQDLHLYFPDALRQGFRKDLEAHRLRREIIATFVTNSMVNRVGPTFVTRLGAETGRPGTEIARAYTITRDTFRLRELWLAIEELDNRVTADLQTRMILEVGKLVERATRWFLRRGRHPLSISGEVESFRPAVSRLAGSLDQLLLARDRDKLKQRAERLRKKQVPEPLAQRVASLEFMTSALDIAEIARGHASDVEEVARIYFRIGARFHMDWMRAAAVRHLAGDSPWSQQALDALLEDLFAHQGALTRSVLARRDEALETALRNWLTDNRTAVGRLEALVAELRAASSPELAMFSVVDHQLRLLLAGAARRGGEGAEGDARSEDR